jgi:multidrug efflux system membrane fusion protein
VLRVLIWTAVLLLLAFALYLVFGRKEELKVPTAALITITTVTAKKGNIGVYLDAIGTVTPAYTASIFSQVTGVLFAVNYQEGQLVNKGDPLTDIDDRPQKK